MSALRITGTLGRAAEARTSTDGVAWLCIELHQGAGSMAATARLRIGHGPAAQIAARHKARLLPAGSRVTVHAAGYAIAHLPSDHLVLLGVDFIEHQAPAPHHEVRDAVEVIVHQPNPAAA
jgi:hypothetical protein